MLAFRDTAVEYDLQIGNDVGESRHSVDVRQLNRKPQYSYIILSVCRSHRGCVNRTCSCRSVMIGQNSLRSMWSILLQYRQRPHDLLELGLEEAASDVHDILLILGVL